METENWPTQMFYIPQYDIPDQAVHISLLYQYSKLWLFQQERRKALEAERQARLQEIQDRRKQRETEFELRQQEKEKERVEAARSKERGREERIAALNAQQQAHIQELQKKIQIKVCMA